MKIDASYGRDKALTLFPNSCNNKRINKYSDLKSLTSAINAMKELLSKRLSDSPI